MPLADLQEAFQEYLLLSCHPCEGGGPFSAKEDSRLRGNDKLKIYAQMYFSRLLTAMELDFSYTAKGLGEAFLHLAKDYLFENPSQQPNIRRFAKAFPTFCATHLQEAPWWAEMAQLDWRLSVASDAENTLPLSMDALVEASQERDLSTLALTWHPSVHFLKHQWNLPEQLSNLIQDAPLVPWQKAPGTLLIWRQEYDVKFSPLSIEQSTLVDAITQQCPLAMLTAHVPEAFITSVLPAWIQAECFHHTMVAL